MQRMLIGMALRQLTKVANGKDAFVGRLRTRATDMIMRADEDETPASTDTAPDALPAGGGGIIARRDGARRKMVTLKPLMSDAAMDLFFWLSDELEVASPNLSLHARVSLEAMVQFGHAMPHGVPADIKESQVDLLIVDETGLPVAALIFDPVEENSARTEMMADLLEMAELPVLQLDPASAPEAIWDALQPLIAYEIAA